VRAARAVLGVRSTGTCRATTSVLGLSIAERFPGCPAITIPIRFEHVSGRFPYGLEGVRASQCEALALFGEI
jgi:hypothetical protein